MSKLPAPNPSVSKSYLPLVLLLVVVATGTGCTALDKAFNPEKYMTPAERAELKRKRDAFAARNIQNTTAEGEAHDEARDASLAGRYALEKRTPGEFSVPFKKKKKPGHHRIASEMTLFANGSCAQRTLADEHRGVDGKWSYGQSQPGPVRRGQWKTQGDQLLVRQMTMEGYGGWASLGSYEKKGNALLILNKSALESELRGVAKDDLGGALAAVNRHTNPWKMR